MRNPALTDLAVLVGDWRVELTNAGFLESGASMDGTLRCEWLDDAFIVLRSSADRTGGPPASVSVIGRNEARDDYELLYYDERGVSRTYRMTFGGGVWTQHRADPGFHQRFDAALESDERISGSWTRSHDDGVTWEHDFDLTYTRI